MDSTRTSGRIDAGSGDNLAFIVGHYKSGSTWLVNLLSLHPDVRGLRETHVFRLAHTSDDLTDCTRQLFSTVAWADGGQARLLRHRLAAWTRPFRRYGAATLEWRERPTGLLDLSIRDQRKLERRLLAATSPDDYCRRFYAFLVDRLAPPRYLVDKTPTNIAWVDHICNLYPNAKTLAVYRDGRDVVVSDRFHLRNEYGREQDLERSIHNWREAMEAQRRAEAASGLFAISYEDMLQKGKETLVRVLDYLGLSKDESTLEDMLWRSSFKFVSGRARGNENSKSFYRKGVAGDWREQLEPRDLEVFSRLAGKLLVDLGYESEADWQRW